jgi:CO/xanthine dehydrogenase Mo-binding subunit
LHTVLTAATAEAVGLRPEQVRINPTDTGTCPWDVGTHASRGAFMACNAAIRAAEVLRQKIFALAAELFCAEAHKQLRKLRRKNPDLQVCDFDLESVCRPDSFELQDGLITVRGAPDEGWLKLDLSTLLRAAHFRPQGTMLNAEAFYDPPNELPDWERGWGNMSATYAWGAQGAQVEVDTDTGEVRLLKMVMVHDVGRVLNPQTLRGQMLGALAQGVGYALYEQVLSQEGRILNPNFRDYKIPTICEMDFPVDLDFVETDDPEGPFGAKGVGEPGLVPTAPAISNAIYDAVGVRIHDLPITPEKVLAALAERDRK